MNSLLTHLEKKFGYKVVYFIFRCLHKIAAETVGLVISYRYQSLWTFREILCSWFRPVLWKRMRLFVRF